MIFSNNPFDNSTLIVFSNDLQKSSPPFDLRNGRFSPKVDAKYEVVAQAIV